MDYPKRWNKIRDIVRLQQILKKWKSLANVQKSNRDKGMKLVIKRSLSYTDDQQQVGVPKGYLAVCVGVGRELKRFVIPTHYLTHQAFQVLLREAEEEFGFQQQGVLQIPCHISVFENILTNLHINQQHLFFHNHPAPPHDSEIIAGLIDCDDLTHHHPQMCT